MSYSSKNLRDADALADDYQTSFEGKYSPDENYSFGSIGSFNVKGMWNLIVLSRIRLSILFGVCFVVSMMILNKIAPQCILNRRRSIEEEDTVDTLLLIKYSLMMGFVLSVVIFALSYKFPFIKSILFKEEDCELCKA